MLSAIASIAGLFLVIKFQDHVFYFYHCSLMTVPSQTSGDSGILSPPVGEKDAPETIKCH